MTSLNETVISALIERADNMTITQGIAYASNATGCRKGAFMG